MISIYKYIFYNVCDKNIDTYNDFMETISNDYAIIIKNIREVLNTMDCLELRRNIHSLTGVLSTMKIDEAELNYIFHIFK